MSNNMALAVSRGESYAPIALFVYARPEHTRRTVEALQANYLAGESDLFVFADAAREKSSVSAVRDVREYVRAIRGFRSLTCIERDQNLGLSNSIVDGVTRLCGQYGRAIAVEDDIMTAPDFLSFLNSGLNRYSKNPQIFSVGGFNLPITIPPSYSYDAFCSYRFMCWGWGTWKDRWEKADWSVKDFREFTMNREQRQQFNRGGNDLSWLLQRHVAGKVDSWDAVWAYTHFLHEAFTISPVVSRSYNIGFDGSGIHCGRRPLRQTPLIENGYPEYRFPESLDADPYFSAQIARLRHRSVPVRLGRYLYDKLNLRSGILTTKRVRVCEEER
jgi:hypothetical protein